MTEKRQAEQNAAQRQKELLAEAFDRARENGGAFLNAGGKTGPRLYPGGNTVSPFNSLFLSLHSERNGYKTNLYIPFPEAKKRGDAVQAGEKGVPFTWYRWNEYRNKSNPDQKISREEFDKLDTEQKKGFSPIRDREIRTLFNIEQTTLPLSDKEAFSKAVSEYGPAADRGIRDPEDKRIRMEVNSFLQNMAANLVPIRKDGTGIAHYDSAKDVIHLPAQKQFPTYADYVQEALRKIVTATGHPQRIARPGIETEGGRAPSEKAAAHERLVVELSSAIKMNQLGLPAKLSAESISQIDVWKKSMDENPHMIDSLEKDVNNALGMITKAERGEKIELKPLPERKVEQTDKVNASIVMVRDDAGKWALFIKPESEKGFSIYPEKDDVGRFFASAKKNGVQPEESFRQELAQKYYTLASREPNRKVDLFSTSEKDIDISAIERVSIYRTKGEGIELSSLISRDAIKIDRVVDDYLSSMREKWTRGAVQNAIMESQKRPTEPKFIYDKDWVWQKLDEFRREQAKKEDTTCNVILNKKEMWYLSNKAPKDKKEMEALYPNVARITVSDYGDQILKIIKNGYKKK